MAPARIYRWRRMRRSRVPSNGPGRFFAAQFSAGCTTNMSGFDFRQAQVIDRMVSDARVLMSESIGFAAICSNDAASYPEDSFENMKRFAKAHDFPFPYLHNETQTVARAYGAVCTPDFFGYNTDRRLKYRGRLDEGRTTPPRAEAPRELVEAMRAIAITGVAPDHQKASIGCSIKWKDE